MSETFRPSLREDGSFDPDCLEQAGQRWVTAWLKGRLSGNDPYFPIDKRGDEDPEGLVIAILEDVGTVHPATRLIGGGILDLLAEARKRAPQTPPYLESALQICERVRLPQTSIWFTEELRRLAADPIAVEESWGEDLTEEILYGAILQSPGLLTAASYASWRAILRMPRYATMAWMGLAQSFDASLEYIADWWTACPASERQAEIDQLIFTGLKTEGTERVRGLMSRRSRSWPAELEGLEAAVDSALEKNGVSKVFVDWDVPELFYENASIGSTPHLRSTYHEAAVAGAPIFPELVSQSATIGSSPYWSGTHLSAMDGAARDRETVLQEQRVQAA